MKYPLEEVVHKLIFPMRSTSDEIPSHDQNLWIVDERLSFHSYISSDKQLRSNAGRLESDSKLRPDLFVYDEKVFGKRQKTFSAVFPHEINNEEAYIDEVIAKTQVENYKIYPKKEAFWKLNFQLLGWPKE